ncbi:MAG: 30S ribosome-binding factor RbfA [Planctomycetes bacterium]|nr:30S ribosome-binding factor RbfA [Planctomycetota bacterium]
MSIRVERVAKKVKFLIATAIQRELNDPRMGFVTIVRCDLSGDYRHCRVHVSVLADTEGEISRVMHCLDDARGFIQRYVAHNLETRATPRLEFIRDTGAEQSVDMSALLDDLRKEREAREEVPGEGDGSDDAQGEAAESGSAETSAQDSEPTEPEPTEPEPTEPEPTEPEPKA